MTEIPPPKVQIDVTPDEIAALLELANRAPMSQSERLWFISTANKLNPANHAPRPASNPNSKVLDALQKIKFSEKKERKHGTSDAKGESSETPTDRDGTIETST